MQGLNMAVQVLHPCQRGFRQGISTVLQLPVHRCVTLPCPASPQADPPDHVQNVTACFVNSLPIHSLHCRACCAGSRCHHSCSCSACGCPQRHRRRRRSSQQHHSTCCCRGKQQCHNNSRQYHRSKHKHEQHRVSFTSQLPVLQLLITILQSIL